METRALSRTNAQRAHRRRQARRGVEPAHDGPSAGPAGGRVGPAHGGVEQRHGDPVRRVLEPGRNHTGQTGYLVKLGTWSNSGQTGQTGQIDDNDQLVKLVKLVVESRADQKRAPP